MESYLNILADIQNDRSSGAWVITQKTITCIEALLSQIADVSAAEISSAVEKIAADVLKSQPAMAQLTNLFNTVFVTIEENRNEDGLFLARRIRGEVCRFREFSQNAVARIAEIGAELIVDDCVVLLHSNSSTVLEIIKKACADGRTFQVVVSESRPVAEGRDCARELSKLGIQTTYFVDAAISRGLDRCDLVFLGADSLSEKMVVNKVGSKAICLLARESVIPCYAACESSKFIPGKLAHKKEPPRDPSEVWSTPPPDVTVENYYFDEVEIDLFSGILTEEGIASATEIASQVKSQKLSKKFLEMTK